jgi:heme-degrading monooxygenase HmoA
MIAGSNAIVCRRWRDRIRTEDEAAYASYFAETGAPGYAATGGCLGHQLLYRRLGDGITEVVTLSWWRSMADIVAFAGDDVARARYYPEDARYLLDRPEEVEHLVVAAGSLPA